MKHFACILLILSASETFSQSSQVLQLNRTVEGELGPGQFHDFSITMKANQFAVIIVQQKGIDLLLTTHQPNGPKIADFDSPNGKQGPEVASISSTTAGKYTLKISPLNADETGGKYSVELIRLEAKASTPEKQIDQLMSTLVLPGSAGATVAVSKGNKVVFSKGYGLANPEYDVANTPGTIFHVASVSKQFTAFAIAMLADQGKLSLDDDIRKYLPELHDFGHKITIRHLAHHTSGLRDQWNLLAMAGWRLDDVITKNQVLQLISHQRELNFKPGDEMVYCNTGYTLMGEIVARITGTSFAQWCQDNIFKPLAMNNTLFYDDHERIVKGRAYSFHDSPDGLKKSVLSYANAGATSLFTTAEDLLKWSQNFQQLKVGNTNVMKIMEERVRLNKGDTLTYAFGQDIGKYKGIRSISHGGADAGYRTFLLRFPDQQSSIAVLSNLASFNPGRVAFQIADIYLKDALKEETPKPEEKKVSETSVTVSEDLLKLYTGQYELGPGFIVSFRVEEGSLVAQATGQPSVKMTPRSETEFYNSSINASITFEKDEKNGIKQFTLRQNGQTMVAPRMKDFDPASVDLKRYTGIFFSPELETRYTLVVEDDILVAKHIRHEPFKLKPQSENTFNSDVWFMGSLEFTLNQNGEVNGFKASSGRVRNVKFEKE